MAIGLALISVVIIAMSAYGMALPRKLISPVRNFMEWSGSVWFAALIRLLLAVLLWFTASASHTPTIFKILALVTLLVAVTLPFLGAARMIRLIDYFASWPPMAIRGQCLLGVLFGMFVLWSLSPALAP
ncbi:MAG: hypothetical protein ACR2Q4_07495 [Geminicoccaceae bacterium]